MIIRLTRTQMSSLVEETRKRYPIETCGLLFGELSCKEAIVKRIVPVQNVLDSSTVFQIDPEQFIKILLKAENEGLEHLGFFHSHPADPSPSAGDVKYMKLWPEQIWLVISSLDYSMKAYRTKDEDRDRSSESTKTYNGMPLVTIEGKEIVQCQIKIGK